MSFKQTVLDVCHEMSDLSLTGIAFTVSGDKVYLESLSTHEVITIVIDECGFQSGKAGKHILLDSETDEYELFDLVETCYRSGFDTLYIHSKEKLEIS